MTRKDVSVGYDIVPRRRTVYPRINEEFHDLRRLIADFVLDQAPRLKFGKGARIVLQGSCFAENLFNELRDRGYPCFYNNVVEALNSPLANLRYFEGLQQDRGNPMFQHVVTADVFVLTIGVAPCWFEKHSGQFTMQPDLRRIDHYVQRTLSVGESSASLKAVFDVLYRMSPNLTIVVTLSPVPLGRTFEFDSAIVADCISKSTLRAAIHETITSYEGRKPVYFPAFEIVRWVGGHVGNAFGDDGLPRHVAREYVKQIIDSFLRTAGDAGDPT